MVIVINVRLARQVPEAGQPFRIGQFRCVDDQPGLGRLAGSYEHGNAGYAVDRRMNLGRVESRVNQPPPGTFKGFQVRN